MQSPNKDALVGLTLVVDYLLDLKMELEASLSYGMDVGTADDLLVVLNKLLDEDEVAPVAKLLGYEPDAVDGDAVAERDPQLEPGVKLREVLEEC